MARAQTSRQWLWAGILSALTLPAAGAGAATRAELERDFNGPIRATLKQYCFGCHSTEKHKGDLDLERFSALSMLIAQPKVWQGVVEQLALGEMPPKEKPQPTTAERESLLAWVNAALDEAAAANAGDPGPVVLRRLSNAEYTFTLRDLTGVESLDPAREFPGDSASGEGFMNVGNSLVMSPSLVTKYLDAAKDVAAHAVLLPDGIRFSPGTSPRDWSDERLAAIRRFYARFAGREVGSSVDLQGIKFDTKDGGALPLPEYLAATLADRDALRSGSKSAAEVARARGLNARYLGILWRALNDSQPSLLLDEIRPLWRAAGPEDAGRLAARIGEWQRVLWRFAQVGHIGKRDGPKAWQEPVTPLASKREFRLKIPTPAARGEVTLYLAASAARPGNSNNIVVWQNPRLLIPGRADLPLREVQDAVEALTAGRAQVFSSAARCLAAATEVKGAMDTNAVARLARRHRVQPASLSAWLGCLGIGAGEVPITSLITQKTESVQGYDFVKGWTGADALSVLANSSGQHVRVPGNLKPHSVAVHPAPKRRVIVGWRSPVAGILRVDGLVQPAHPECGNGVTWTLELRRGPRREQLAGGSAQGGKEVTFGPLDKIPVQRGDVIALGIGPRDGNHSCDLTALALTLSDGSHRWNLADDVSPTILAGNPHADSLGHPGVWHFYSEPDVTGGADPIVPAGSWLAKWQAARSPREKRRAAAEVQKVLMNGGAGLAPDAPDAVLVRRLSRLNGPLLGGLWQQIASQGAPRALRQAGVPDGFGLNPLLFGRHPDGMQVDATTLCVRAPSLLEVRLPADLVEGCEFAATGALHKETGREGSVQLQVLTTRPAAPPGLAPGAVRVQGTKGYWSDGDRPVVSDSPIIVQEGSDERQRIETALDEFRQLFPLALCYTKIVPVDEVVTLTLFHREDAPLRRLMLNEAEAAEIDRLWAELHYVSQDALKLVDVFEQLWQFATQDADPSAFESLRQPILQRAASFKKLLVDTQPAHLDAVLEFAERAYRRPLAAHENEELRALYRRLREQEVPHEGAIRLTLARVLVAPAFLYRAEVPGPGDASGPVNDWELATRLSYFLWSSAPDSELRAVAAGGRLRDPDVLAAQARRMLRDPRVRRLATEFACAWLHIYDFAELGEKSERHFPTFAGLRGAMHEETIRFFTDLFQRDGTVLEILDADHTFLNEPLAAHYGIPGVKGADWRRVEGVKQYARGGILAQATTLARQSGASRTSPILRGNWLCEVLLGEKLPRPPKDVPRLPEDEAAESLTVRQLTEKHSTDPKCYGCHRRIDPYGYSLEGFDAIGRRRDLDLGGRPIDTRATLMSGARIEGLDGLRDHLLTARRDAFLKQFCRKLIGYSLGRGVLLSDTPLLSELRARLKSHDYHLGAAIETIVRSKQFREIRGKDRAHEE